MIIIKEFYRKDGTRYRTAYTNTELPDIEFNSLAEAQLTTRTTKYRDKD